MSDPDLMGRRRGMQAAGFAARFAASNSALLALAVFAMIVAVLLIGPLVHSVDPQYLDIRNKNLGSSVAHPMGTDNLGRDTLARVLVGGRISLLVGVVAMLLSLGVGVLVGVLAGYYTALDAPLMRLTDLFLALPLLPLLLLAMLLFREPLRYWFGAEAGTFLLIVAVIGISGWMPTARIVRAEVLTLKERDFVLAARSVGTPGRKIISRHILANASGPIIVCATLGIASAIITESALSFLGLGFPPDSPSWGRLLNDGAGFISVTPARVLWPGLAITLTVLSINYIGDGIRAALDPRTHGADILS